MKKLTLNEFIERAIEKHGNKYDYSLVVYNGGKNKVKIICPKHGVFEQNASKHLCGDGCAACAGNKKLDNKSFIKISNKIHNNRYNYSLVKYNGFENKVKIICKIHGIFEQTPNKHIGKTHRGCPKCNGGVRKTIEHFIEQSIKIHNNKYDYSLVDYKNGKTNVKIICKEHGIFEQQPRHHINGCGCPKCKESNGEKYIEKYLKDKNIKYIRQKSFSKCKNIKPLPFDFYLTQYNMCIEFDGEQHYRVIEYFGGLDAFILRQKKDEIKTLFCKENNIKLLRIKYNENIENKLNLWI